MLGHEFLLYESESMFLLQVAAAAVFVVAVVEAVNYRTDLREFVYG
jgi:hypothetical protein